MVTLKTITDHLGRILEYRYPPQRIVSLCPPLTETMYDLGLDDKIVGRTGFCKHPEEKVKQAVKVGGTKTIKPDRIKELEPDLIICEKEENTKAIVETLEADFPVFVFEIQTVMDAYNMVTDLGEVTGKKTEAEALQKDIQSAFNLVPQMNQPKAVYVVWQDPLMIVGGNTYIQSVLDTMGFINPFKARSSRYPSVTVEELNQASLDYVFLATEPYPFREKHLETFQEMIPGATPMIIDGEMFWYGSKMLKAAKYFQNLFSPMT